MATLIGKRSRLIIGDGAIHEDEPGTIIGQDTTLRVSTEEAKSYDKIVGEEHILIVGNPIDKTVEEIINKLNKGSEPNKDRVIEAAQDVIRAKNKEDKLEKVRKLIDIGVGLTSIASSLLDLKSKLGI